MKPSIRMFLRAERRFRKHGCKPYYRINGRLKFSKPR